MNRTDQLMESICVFDGIFEDKKLENKLTKTTKELLTKFSKTVYLEFASHEEVNYEKAAIFKKLVYGGNINACITTLEKFNAVVKAKGLTEETSVDVVSDELEKIIESR